VGDKEIISIFYFFIYEKGELILVGSCHLPPKGFINFPFIDD
jgi:hypothetical protein